MVEYERALQLDPKMDAIHNNLGCDYLYLGRLDEAVRHLELTVNKDANFAEGLYNLGTARLARTEYAEAEKCFLRLLQLRPELPQGYVGLALAQYQEV